MKRWLGSIACASLFAIGCGHNIDEETGTRTSGITLADWQVIKYDNCGHAVYAYPGYATGKTRALIILHGMGGNQTAVINQATTFPDAFVAWGYQLMSVRSCAPGDWDTNGGGDVANIKAQSDWLRSHGFTSWSAKHRIVGMSQGGNMASQVALYYPSEFNKIGCMSSPCKRVAGVNASVNLYFAHGAQDTETTPAEIQGKINAHIQIGGYAHEYYFGVGGHQWYPSVNWSWASFLAY